MSKDTDLFNFIFNSFNWDKDFYSFNRDEKDMRPYSIVNQKDKVLIVHNVLGINKADLQVSYQIVDGYTFIKIEGKSTDELTGKNYTIHSRFKVLDDNLELKNTTSFLKNGLLYIEIPFKAKEKQSVNTVTRIKIQ